MVRIEGLAGFPNGKDQVQEFAHAMPQGDIAPCAFGPEPTIEGPHGRVVLHGGEGRIPQVHPD
jgi:hypothetical protein